MRRRCRAFAALAATFFMHAAAPSPAPAGGAAFGLQGDIAQGGVAKGAAPRGTVSLSLNGKRVPLDSQGRFILGFDRDEAPRAVLAARLGDGSEVREQLTVAPRAWRIEHVSVAARSRGPSEEFLRIRKRELARIAASRAADSGAEGWRQDFTWPAKGRISGRFGAQRVYRGEPGAYHTGVDVAAGAGAPVAAPADGVVVLAGPPAFSLEGNLVIVDHGMGLNSAFLHLDTVTVREGQRVARGERIGTVGATGRATGPHLHWSMKWREARIDPESLAGPMR